MPIESFEEEGLAKIPNIELAQWKFLLKTEKFKDDPKIKKDLFEAIKADSRFIWCLKYCLGPKFWETISFW